MNSPLTTAVVGTSAPPSRPKTPLAPAMTTTSATKPTPPAIFRLLLRDMPLHRHSSLEARRHHDLVVAHRPEGHRSRPDAIDLLHAARELETRIRVERDAGRLAGLEHVKVSLIDLDPHQHRGRIDDE